MAMTDEQMADWLEYFARAVKAFTFHIEKADAIAARLRQSCANCEHADTENTIDGWCACAAPATYETGDQYPFAHRTMPLDERCKGWTPRKDC